MPYSRNHSLRYLGIVTVFCIICVIYLGRLFYIQIAGRESSYSTGIETRTVTVQAVRGEIYDRNGIKLVENRYTYDMSLSYSSFYGMSVHEKNSASLQLLDALATYGTSVTDGEKFFPFERYYPYYVYSAEATDGNSVRYYRLQRVLEDLGMKADADADTLCRHYVETYDLLAEDSAGVRYYDDDQIDALIRLYYDMDARRFRVNGEYAVLQEVPSELMTYIKERDLDSVTFTLNVQRVYLYPGYASHILGTVGPIYQEEWEYYNEMGYQMSAIVGKDGCEAAFEEYLHGVDGSMEIETDGNGNIVGMKSLREPIAGRDVYLTIDIELQIAAEDGLAENVEYVSDRSGGNVAQGSGCNAGAAVVMDPDTFEVLAIASHPTYDLNTYNQLYDELAGNAALPLFNRALYGSYAPGSTYKLGMAAIALMEGEITPATTFTCVGKYPSKTTTGGVGCSTYGENHWGGENVIDAIADSCNSFFCKLGDLLGIETIEKYMKKFGFGESTGFELGGISGILAGPTYLGQIQSEYPWTAGNTWQSSIGQSDNQSSPLQLACYIGTLVNGGTRYTAHLLHSVYEFGSDVPSYVFEQSEDTVLDKLEIPQTHLDTVLEGMREVVSSSSLIQRWIDSDIPVTVGGKTGTAQNSTECDNALFVCTAPYDDPDVVISVVLEQGYTGGYASLTAGRILEAYYGLDEE
ncbi:MAG: hypothetical protein IJX80_04540 [Clostridia bacterium]|nr:hypothetical protein [Clostridia bacterium]